MEAEKIVDHIVKWMVDYTKAVGIKGFVVGVSGGIDSAVTSTLCARTGLKVICIEMPIHQGKNQVNRSREHIAFLTDQYNNVSAANIDLTTVFDTFKNLVPKTDNKEVEDLAMANTRARMRMMTLYYFAGLHGYLVAGTGNKVEDFGVGFFTKYGDGGVDISPIADLMKSEVYAIAKHLEVPNSIQQAAPTDGLFGDSRTDEDQIGATYDELEWAMNQFELKKSSEDFTGREQEVFKIFLSRHYANKHKMEPIPVCMIPDHLKK